MAYNVLKGIVEGSVDQHADQEISGIKVFKSTISASVFYDTDAGSPCATLKDVAIKEIKGTQPGAILAYDSPGKVQAHYTLKYDGTTLTTRNIVVGSITGSGCGLKELPVDKFDGVIEARYLQHGAGLHNIRGRLQVKATEGLQANKEGIGISLNTKSGLAVKGKHLVVDPTKAEHINQGGQNLSDQDVVLVTDISKNALCSTTLQNLYDGYLHEKVPQPAGANQEIQLKDGKGFGSSPKFWYDTAQNALHVEGKTSTADMEVEGTLVCKGAVFQNITTITQSHYEVADDDYSLMCDTIDNSITITLPPACNNMGRVLIIKKANTDKYNLRSYPIAVKTPEGRIDITKEIIIKMNSSSRTLQSDGTNWWIIGSRGT
tara:strand:+ start:905 stop:2032 length:1128 start_codon:yes stop_codon:yes gene_type:complete